jgi:hypothetical protein
VLGLKSKAKSTPKRIVAIELSSSDLVYAIVERPEGAEGETRLTWRRLPWRKEATSLTTTEGKNELAAALTTVVTGEKLSGAPCQFALGGDFCVTRVVAGTNEQVEKELKSLEQRSSHYLSLGTGEKSFTRSTRAIDAKRAQGWMTVTNEKTLEAITAAAKEAGLKTTNIEHSLITLSRAVGRTERDAESPVIIIHLNKRGVDMGVSYQGRLLLDYRPGGVAAKDHLCETVLQHLDRIQRYCSRHFQFASDRITRVILCGEATDLQEIQQQFSSQGRLTAEAIDPREVCREWSCEGVTASDAWLLPILGSLASSLETTQAVDSPDLMEPLRLKRREPLGPLLLRYGWPIAASILLTLGIYGASFYQQRCAASLEASAKEATSRQDLIISRQRQLAETDAKIKYLTRIDAQLSRPMWHDFLAQVGGCLPKGVWLESMQVDREGRVSLQGPSFTEDGIYQFVKQLGGIQIVNSPALEQTHPIQLANGPATMFDVKCSLSGRNGQAKGT